MNTTLQTQTKKSGLESHPDQVSAKRGAYERITERVIELLNAGTVPWHKPWDLKRGFPRNLISKKPYRGINVFLLHAMRYESPFWLTFHQAQQIGASIRKGEKACPVVFWKPYEVEDRETKETKMIPLLRFYYVFNVAQCDGLKNLPNPAAVNETALTLPAEIVETMPQRPAIKHGMSAAFYSPSADFVGMTDRERFTAEAGYFTTLFHELIHSTGHKSRLNRASLIENQGFGSDPYCREELVAEMGAAFLCGQAGIVERTLDNSAAYLQNWLAQLQNDKTLIVHAAAQAQKAADFILGTKFDETPAES